MAVKRPNHHRTRGRPNPTARPPKRIKRATASFFSLTSYAVGLTCRRIAGNLLLNHTYALHSVFTLHKLAGEKNKHKQNRKGLCRHCLYFNIPKNTTISSLFFSSSFAWRTSFSLTTLTLFTCTVRQL
jgi:hypothetical protein